MKRPLLFVFAILLSLQNIPIAVSKPNSNLNLNPNAAKSTSTSTSRRKLVIGVDGGTESIRACCFDAATGEVVGKSCAVPYTTFHPQPGWAEQHPTDWYQNLCEAVRGALKSLDDEVQVGENEENGESGGSGESSILVCTKDDVTAICVDTTCCSVVALDEKCEPLRPALLWMDARSAPQTVEIMDKCKGDPALSVNCNGDGPISAEWMTPKALWIKQNEPNVWKHALHICEYQDYINYRLTGVMCASSCNAAVRWHWDGEECIKNNNSSSSTTSDNSGNSGNSKKNDKYRGRPMSLYTKLGMPELADKLPEKCLSMGSLVGHLTKEAASHLGLNEGLPVAQGGPDAFVGMVGLGCVYPQQLCLITGSSHLHCVVTSKPTTATGTWGAYRGAPVPGINFAEGGQSSTGSIIRWAKAIFGAQDVEYKVLDEEAEKIEPGCDGLVALETFQGSRTPVTDPLARGALVGLTLSHSRAHIWRALMEAVCFGTRACVDGLEDAGHSCNEIIIAGGTTRSKLWLQMHADVTNKPVVLCENIDAPLLGCAILASVVAGVHDNVQDAVKEMVRESRRVEPNVNDAEKYDRFYNEVYSKVSPAVQPVVHAIASLRGGGDLRQKQQHRPNNNNGVTVSPSLLACDWTNIESEIKRCLAVNLKRLHIDVFDGVFLNSPDAFTFGPQMVKAMRSVSDEVILDIHLCVERPSRFVESMSKAGASRIIFQWEAMNKPNDAKELAQEIVDNAMFCGISINPETDVSEIMPLLETGLCDTVNILGVNPGFGGQELQERSLQKLTAIRSWADKNKKDTSIVIDGGVNDKTKTMVKDAGANVLVAGSYLFKGNNLEEGALRDL